MVDEVNGSDDIDLGEFNFDDLPSVDDLPDVEDSSSLSDGVDNAELRKEPFFEASPDSDMPFHTVSAVENDGGHTEDGTVEETEYPFAGDWNENEDLAMDMGDNEPVSPLEPAPWETEQVELATDENLPVDANENFVTGEDVAVSDAQSSWEQGETDITSSDFAFEGDTKNARFTVETEGRSTDAAAELYLSEAEDKAEPNVTEIHSGDDLKPEQVFDEGVNVAEVTDDAVENMSENGVPHGITESPTVRFLRAYSGSSDDAMFEISRGFASKEVRGDENCRTIHIDVGYDTYGWTVSFDNGVEMNVRDVREYQIRHGELPAQSGKISYGASCLTFANIERIVIYETVRYFSYGM